MTGAAIRIAFISAARTQAEIIREKLNLFGTFAFVHIGKDLKTNFKEIVKSAPQVIIVDTSSEIDYYRNFDPQFLKVKRFLPQTKILIRTELREQHPFIQEALENGASIVDERLAYAKISQTLHTIVETGQQVVRYEARRHDLEHSANPWHYGRELKPKFIDHRNFRPVKEKEL